MAGRGSYLARVRRRLWRFRRWGYVSLVLTLAGIAIWAPPAPPYEAAWIRPLAALLTGMVVGVGVLLLIALIPILRSALLVIAALQLGAFLWQLLPFGDLGSVSEILQLGFVLATAIALAAMPLPFRPVFRASRRIALPVPESRPRLDPRSTTYWDLGRREVRPDPDDPLRFTLGVGPRLLRQPPAQAAVLTDTPEVLEIDYRAGRGRSTVRCEVAPEQGGTRLDYAETVSGFGAAVPVMMWLDDGVVDFVDDLEDTLLGRRRLSRRASETGD